MTRVSALLAALVAASAVGVVGIAPASSQAGPPAVSISPTSGPIGTEITATITNCTPPETEGGEARLDFAFEGFTPANSELFAPDQDGTATVTIVATEKEGQSEGLTAAEVNVLQCGNEGVGSAPFTVVRTSTTTTQPTTPTTQPTTPTTQATTGTQESGTTTPRSAPASPVRDQAKFTG